MRWIRRSLSAASLLIAACLLVLTTPHVLFAYQLTHGRFHVWSDRPIDPASAVRVLDDAERRLATSALDSPDHRFQIFVCNDNWKLALYSQQLSGQMGGVADGWLTQNIYLREANFQTNQIVPPRSWMYDRSDRPLSYYIAHEATHILEAKAFGRLYAVRYPTWLVEGYADYVGKAGQFDVADNLRLLKSGDPRLDPKASGLYRRYHLEVAYVLDHQGRSTSELFEDRAEERQVRNALERDQTFGTTR